MRKRLIIMITLLLSAAILIPVSKTAAISSVNANENIDTEKQCSLEVAYSSGNMQFEGLEIQLYKVAEVSTDFQYKLCGAFTDYPVNINNTASQSEWNQLSTTLNSYVIADNIAPTKTAVTDSNGKAVFSDISCGMYLVADVDAVNSNTVYHFAEYMLSVPTIDNNGTLSYNVKAKPKSIKTEPLNKQVEYKAVKIWKDSGSDKRPNSVEVAVYKNGIFQESRILSSENNWSYFWRAVDDGSEWTVIERNIPNGYKVSIEKNSNSFLLLNTYSEESIIPPKTGDNQNQEIYLIIFIVIGIILLVSGIIYNNKLKKK